MSVDETGVRRKCEIALLKEKEKYIRMKCGKRIQLKAKSDKIRCAKPGVWHWQSRDLPHSIQNEAGQQEQIV